MENQTTEPQVQSDTQQKKITLLFLF